MEKDYLYKPPMQPAKGYQDMNQYPMGPTPCCGINKPCCCQYPQQMNDQEMPFSYPMHQPYEMGDYPQQMMPPMEEMPDRPPYGMGQCPMCGCMIPPYQQSQYYPPYGMEQHPMQAPGMQPQMGPSPTPRFPRGRF